MLMTNVLGGLVVHVCSALERGRGLRLRRGSFWDGLGNLGGRGLSRLMEPIRLLSLSSLMGNFHHVH